MRTLPYIKLALIIGMASIGSLDSVASAAPSFDCSKATTWSEMAVCKDSRLSDLDREVGSLYREAKARTMPLAQKVLKTDQKEWLSRREKCRQKANAADCLFRVYRRRIDELAGWAGRRTSEDERAEELARSAEPLPEITADVVWDEDSVPWREDCDNGDFECVLDAMRSTGASEQAVAFARRVEGWAYAFEELGKVDLVSWVQAFAANIVDGQYLVNGSPDLIAISVYEFTVEDRLRPDVRKALARLADGFLANNHFVRKEAIPGGTRFIVEADYVRCNACRNESLAHAQIAYDVNEQGVFQGEKLLKVSLPEERDSGEPPETSQPALVAGIDQGPRVDRAEWEVGDRVRVKDGSVLIGRIEGQKLNFQSSVGDIEVDVREVLGFSDGALRLIDGAVFKGSFVDSKVGIVTSRGMVEVHLKEVVEISRGRLE